MAIYGIKFPTNNPAAKLRQRPLSVLLLSTALTLPSTSLLAGWQAPLSSEEQAAATSLALDSATAELQPRNSTADDSASGLPTLENEVLLVELKHTKKNQGARIAEVFVFDYNRGVTELHRINIEDNRVLEVIAIASTHLPLNDREQQLARALASEDDTVEAQLQTEYQRAFGQSLSSIADLDMKVSIWQPQSHQSLSSDIASTCEQQRCALISVFTQDNYSFSLEPVVNLMQGIVYPEALQ